MKIKLKAIGVYLLRVIPYIIFGLTFTSLLLACNTKWFCDVNSFDNIEFVFALILFNVWFLVVNLYMTSYDKQSKGQPEYVSGGDSNTLIKGRTFISGQSVKEYRIDKSGDVTYIDAGVMGIAKIVIYFFRNILLLPIKILSIVIVPLFFLFTDEKKSEYYLSCIDLEFTKKYVLDTSILQLVSFTVFTIIILTCIF